MYDVCGTSADTHMICGEEMMPKGQVAIGEASAYYADLTFSRSLCCR